jgi:hypothetical protein
VGDGDVDCASAPGTEAMPMMMTMPSILVTMALAFIRSPHPRREFDSLFTMTVPTEASFVTARWSRRDEEVDTRGKGARGSLDLMAPDATTSVT